MAWLGLKKERKIDFRALEKCEGFRGRLNALEYVVRLFWAAHNKDAGCKSRLMGILQSQEKLNSNKYSVT